MPEKDNADLEELRELAPAGPGVYAITGRHDALSGKSVLYVGKAGGTGGGELRTRVLQSVGDHLLGGQPLELYSDVWDLTVRWTTLSNELVDGVEDLLIMTHSPPFNSAKVRRAELNRSHHDLIVMNSGRKGPLLPILAGAYFIGWQ